MQKKGVGLLGGGGAGSSGGSSTSSSLNNSNRLKSANKRYLCLIISFIFLLTLSFIFIAWNLLCDIDSESTLKFETSDAEIVNRSSDSIRLPRHSVEIYYEVLCPDSKYFILNQLIPVYRKFSRYIHPILIPYGKAFTKKTAGGELQFDCQHGPVECEGNMLHACAIKHISNEHLLISYIHCLMRASNWNTNEFERTGEKCANEYQVSWEILKTCWKSEDSSLLLKSHGESTQALRPSVTFIPTIAVDQSQSYQKDILKDFKTYLCKRILYKENLPICT